MRRRFGSIWQRRPGSWVAIWTAPGGRRRWRGGFKTPTAADAFLARKQVETQGLVRAGLDRRATFAALGVEYLRALRGRGNAPQTLERAEKLWRRIEEDFGQVAVCDVTHELVGEWVESLVVDDRYAPATVRLYVAIVRGAFKVAVAARLARENPCAGLVLPKIRAKPSVYATPEKLRLLLARVDPRVRPYVTLLAATGLRRGQGAALEWPDVADDFSSLVVRADNSKNAETYRVPILAAGRTALREAHAARGARPKDGRYLVFPGVTTGVVDYQLRKAAAAAGLPGFTPHQFRHLLGAHLAESGADVRTIQRVLGHKSLRSTLRYAEHAHDTRDAAMAEVDEMREGHDVLRARSRRRAP